jgi:hypothetical protein
VYCCNLELRTCGLSCLRVTFVVVVTSSITSSIGSNCLLITSSSLNDFLHQELNQKRPSCHTNKNNKAATELTIMVMRYTTTTSKCMQTRISKSSSTVKLLLVYLLASYANTPYCISTAVTTPCYCE